MLNTMLSPMKRSWTWNRLFDWTILIQIIRIGTLESQSTHPPPNTPEVTHTRVLNQFSTYSHNFWLDTIKAHGRKYLSYWMVILLYWIVNTALFISSLPLLWPFVLNAASHFWYCVLVLFTDYDLDCVLDVSAFSSLSGASLDCFDPSTSIIKLSANGLHLSEPFVTWTKL